MVPVLREFKMDWHGPKNNILCRVSEATIAELLGFAVMLRILSQRGSIVHIKAIYCFADVGGGCRRVYVRGCGSTLHLGPLEAFRYLLGLSDLRHLSLNPVRLELLFVVWALGIRLLLGVLLVLVLLLFPVGGYIGG